MIAVTLQDRRDFAGRAYFDKQVDDERARRAVEGRRAPPGDTWKELRHHAPVLSRTMDDWCDASPIEMLDGPLVIHFDDEDDEFAEAHLSWESLS